MLGYSVLFFLFETQGTHVKFILKVVPCNIKFPKVRVFLISCTNAQNFTHDVSMLIAHPKFAAIANLKDLVSILEFTVFLIFFNLIFLD